ncbi:MAG: hypothetical protein IT578_07735 [Verrucomicrobiae bacterium]|nr:hypothetical protein [Verrucomicrobiae bacterium]
MKKLLAVAGAVLAFGWAAVYAGGIANPDRLNARNAVLNADKASASCETSCSYAQSDKRACPKAASCPQRASCAKDAGSCPKVADSSAKSSCSKAATCPMGKKAKTTK